MGTTLWPLLFPFLVKRAYNLTLILIADLTCLTSNQTASVWTNVENADSLETFDTFVNELECGTVFLNRCDYLDPACAWTGVKNSGRGVSLSKFGFDQLTQPKSVHMKIKTT